MATDLKFGDVVIIPHKLKRESEYRGTDWWKIWSVRKFPRPVTGILIGFRTLCDGTVFYGDGCPFTPKTYIKAALVAVNAKAKPYLVRLEAVRNEIDMDQVSEAARNPEPSTQP